MSTSEIAAQFDRISSVYDETREPLSAETVDALARELKAWGVGSVLELGIGTGRIARPLVERGLELTGLDASRGMLARARANGLRLLIRGSAYRTPFRDRAFDAALMVHVLHLLEDPARALREAGRVGRHGAFAVVHPAEPGLTREEERDSLRARLVAAVEAQGVAVPPRGGPPQRKERELLRRLPPEELLTLSDVEVSERLADRLVPLARGGHRHLLHVPPEVLARAVEQVRAEVGERRVTFRRVTALARWPATG